MLADFEKLTLCCSKDCRKVTAVSKLHGWTRYSMHPILGAPEARCTRQSKHATLDLTFVD
jgi:hypothetical protein